MEELNRIKEILKKNNAILLREGDDLDYFCDDLQKSKEILLKEGWIISNNNINYFEAIRCIGEKIYIIEVANTLLHSSRFTVDLKRKYISKYISTPNENDVWLKSIRYLLSLRNDYKAKKFFYSNMNFLNKNDFFLDYLSINPFKKNLDIELLLENKKLFILKYVKPQYLLKIIIDKVLFHFSSLLRNRTYSIMGVDGVGKTTIIEVLKQYNIKSIYMGFKGFYFENLYQKIIGKNKFLTILVHIMVFGENWVRFFKSKFLNFRGYIVIWDRNPVIEYQYNTKIFYPLYKICFVKVKTFILFAKESEIFKRKQERKIKEIKEEQKFLTSLQDAILIENSKIDITVNKILKVIYENNVL